MGFPLIRRGGRRLSALALLLAFGLILTGCGASSSFSETEGESHLTFVLSADGSYYTVSGFDGSIASAVIPSAYLGKPVRAIAAGAFAGLSSLASISIPSSVITIGNDAFSSCPSLWIYCQAASKPSGWDASWDSSNRPVYWGVDFGGVTADGLDYFVVTTASGVTFATIRGYSDSAYNVVIPSAIAGQSVTAIGDSAFEGCWRLASVAIPSSVTYIGDSAFNGCASLSSVSFEGTVAQYDAISESAYIYSDTRVQVVHCSDGDVAVG